MTLEELYKIIEDRKKNIPKNSYVASLIKQGENATLQKIGEEAIEVVIAGKGKRKQRIIEEVSDLFFMTLILLVQKEISLRDIFEELEKRRK